jgi:hypothetical protein
MTIRELIEQLTKLANEHGNVEVWTYSPMGSGPCEEPALVTDEEAAERYVWIE